MKKVIQEIIYCEVEELRDGSCDAALSIDGVDLIDESTEDVIKVLEENNLIKDGKIIIPIGLELTEKKEFGGATEYNFDNGHIVINLCFDCEKEYIA